MWFELEGEIIDVSADSGAPIELLERVIPGTGPMLVDGLPADLALPISTIWEGAVLSRAGQSRPQPIVELVGLRGLDSGACWKLSAGTYDLGGDGGPRISVTPGAEIIRAVAPGRSESVAVGSHFEEAGTVWGVRRPSPFEKRPEPVDGRRVFNRPPRLTVQPGSDPLQLPEMPEEPAPRTRIGWAMLIAPLVMGAVMAVVFRPLMAVIALVGPLMAGMSWIEDRFRLRKARRVNAVEWETNLAELRSALEDAAAVEIRRRAANHPSLTDLARYALQMDGGLWARRSADVDYLSVSVGSGRSRWTPPTNGALNSAPEDVAELVAGASTLSDCPVEVSLAGGGALGVCGDRSKSLALVRGAILRLAIQQGPADLRVAVLTSTREAWQWCAWLPHVQVDPVSRRLRLAAETADIESVIRSLEDEQRDCVVVVDSLDPSIGTRVSNLIENGRISPIFIHDQVKDLPGICNPVVDVDGFTGVLRKSGEEPRPFRVDGVALDVAAFVARCLHGIDDPEDRERSARLPNFVHLTRLVRRVGSDEIMDVWSDPPAGLVAPVGMKDNGTFEIDLVADGPHALVAGTTGSGKSEFLRTLIAGMAARHSPERVNFALIDYKGGSAFDACERLPHVVGLVTDLDGYMARRALLSITAEVRHREQVLRSAGVESIDRYPQSGSEPLPRLVVVVDEFAALSSDLPEFIPALVDVAQRGRSLGIHLILATQRPAGVVGDAIRANTNLRVAFRTQTRAESSDVIGEPPAAMLPRHRPGRGYARLGPGDLVAFQAATVSNAVGREESADLSYSEVTFGWEPVRATPETSIPELGTTDLEALVESIGRAASEFGSTTPRTPWAEALPVEIGLGDDSSLGGAAIGVADEPDRQRVVRLEWTSEEGGLLALGMAGSGSSDALVAACFAQETVADHGSLHIYGIDGGGGALDVMIGWPHVGGVVAVADRERLLRLIRLLEKHLADRQSGSAPYPTVLVGIDRVESVLGSLDGPGDIRARDALISVVTEGPQFGIVPLISALRPAAISANISAGIGRRFCFRLADPFEYSLVGISPKEVPELVRGRGFDDAGRMVQIGMPTAEAMRRLRQAEVGRLPPPIEILPNRVPISDVATGSVGAGSGWMLPVGLGDSDLAPVGFQLYPGDHVLVAGPPRSGRTTTLASMGRLASVSNPKVEILVLVGRDRSLAHTSGAIFETVGGLMDAVKRSSGPTLVLVDDAERITDPALDGLFVDPHHDLHVLAAGRADALRGMYQHWTRQVRRCRLGVSLQPEPDLDGDLWQTRFPRHGPSMRYPGRGYLVSAGQIELVQVAAS